MNKASLFFVLLSVNVFAQNVVIPDANFKAALINNPSINTNSDNEIQLSEAMAYSGSLNIRYLNISDLSGLAAFVRIDSLICNGNNLTSIDLSSNSELQFLNCSSNKLTELDVSNNIKIKLLGCENNLLSSLNVASLTELNLLHCQKNKLSSLDLSSNLKLILLNCYMNQITNLILSSNSEMSYLDCSYNELSTLDLSQNVALNYFKCYNNKLTNLNVKNGNYNNWFSFYSTNNPDLTCILVEDPNYMQANWSNGKDPKANFSLDCSISTNLTSTKKEKLIKISPNPFSSSTVFYINQKLNEGILKVYNIQGKLVQQVDKNFIQEITLNRQRLTEGIYFYNLSDGNTTLATGKISIID